MKSSVTPTWLITYGDLLTLLVCFFVTLLSNGAFPLTKLITKQSNISRDISVIGKESDTQGDGTVLASHGLSPRKELYLKRGDFVMRDMSLLASRRLGIWLEEQERQGIGEIEIDSCENGDARLNKALWMATVIITEIKQRPKNVDKMLIGLSNQGCNQDGSIVRLIAR